MATQATTKWALDGAHSEIGFKIKHLMITTVSGKFNKFEGTVDTDGDDFSTARINFSAEVGSVNTNNDQRDGHLKSAEFFDSEKYPLLTFNHAKLQPVKENKYTLQGDLNLHGATKPVTLDVEFEGVAKDPWGNTKAGFTITGKVNRKDWDLNWNAPLETGGVLLGEEVKIEIHAQLTRQA
jgi:polyisoprenoid-binding protein YceI